MRHFFFPGFFWFLTCYHKGVSNDLALEVAAITYCKPITVTLTLTWQKSPSNLLNTFNGSWQRTRSVWTILGLLEHMRHFSVLKESVCPRCRLLQAHTTTISTTQELCTRFFNAASRFYNCTMSLVRPLKELWLDVDDIIHVKCGTQQIAFEKNHWAYFYIWCTMKEPAWGGLALEKYKNTASGISSLHELHPLVLQRMQMGTHPTKAAGIHSLWTPSSHSRHPH